MPYIKKEYDCGKIKIVEKHFASRYKKARAILNIQNKTTKIQQTVNDRNAMKRYSILANANFKENDYFFTLTFKRGALPNDINEVKEIFAKYRRKIRKIYKKNEIEFKYIYCIEYIDVRPHIHFLFNNDGINLGDLPKWEYGTPHIELLDNRIYHTIGEYFCKVVYDEEKINGKLKKKGILGCSRNNLFRPEPKIQILISTNWEEKPKPEEGYIIDEESLVNGYIEVTERNLCFKYQYYIMIKKE